MEYIKFNIDEMNQQKVFCEYREINDGEKGPMITRAFPLELLGEHEPKVLEMVAGEIIGIYYEKRGSTQVKETNYLDHSDSIEDEEIDWIEEFVKKVCINEVYDELLKPPTVDQQVEDFIKEFFEDEEDEPLEQKDFLAEFFAELEDEEGVLGANAVSAEKLANSSLDSRHFANNSIELKHLATSANLTAQVNTVQANLTANNIQHTPNLNSISTNVASVIANVNIVSGNIGGVAANTIQNKANVDIANANTIQINSNLNVVNSNLNAVIAGSTAFTGQVTMNDDLVITGNLIVNGDTTTANSVNMVVQDRMLMLANSATGAPAADVGILFNRGNQGNAAFFYDESSQTFKVSDTKDPSTNVALSPVTAGNLDVGILTAATVKFNGADLNTAITDNVAALQSRLTTNVTAFTNEDTALQARIAANNTLLHSNDFITFTRLNANINVVNQNVNSGVGLIQRVNSAVSTGSSNVFFVAVPSASQHPSDLNKIEVYIDGIRQRPDSLTGSNHDFVYNSAAASVTVTDPSLPSGLIVIIDALCPPA